MKSLYSILFVLASGIMLAQPTFETFPNFTETDLNGVEHDLYDYLDDGKIVVIDVFATWCPNCTASLPAYHSLEDTYGSDIVLLSFERDANTSNEASWASTNSVTNPIIANAENLVSSTWNITYQPNFFVICPDRSFEMQAGSISSGPETLEGYIDDCLEDQANSINEVNAAPLEVKILSNPVSNELNIAVNTLNTAYTIVNLTGQSVLEGTLETYSSKLDVTALKEGLYFLRAELNGKEVVKKFIKN